MSKYNKEILEKYVNEDKLSYREIGREYGVSDNAIKKACRKLGVALPVRQKNPDGYKPHNAGTAKEIKCLNCNELIERSTIKQKYCNRECFCEHRKELTYQNYINNQEDYCNRVAYMSSIKPHILNEQNDCCNICGIKNEWNNKPLIFVLDHIDGDAGNNLRNNLRLICSNCDSQLDTYKSKNKNSARKSRYLKNYKIT